LKSLSSKCLGWMRDALESVAPKLRQSKKLRRSLCAQLCTGEWDERKSENDVGEDGYA